MCDDCHKIERRFYGFRLTTAITENNTYEAICQTIKEKSSFLLDNQQRQEQGNRTGNIGTINYYDPVRFAYQNNIEVRDYLRCDIDDIKRLENNMEVDLPNIEFRTKGKSCQQRCCCR
jgi:hypothetical protein